MRITIGFKLASAFLLAGLLLIICGLAGYYVASTLSSSLKNITGPVWDSMDSASQGIRAVQKQLIEVDKLLGSSGNADHSGIEKAEVSANKAFEHIRETGRIPDEKLKALQSRMDKFRAARIALMQTNNRFRDIDGKVTENAVQFQDMLNRVERLATQRMLEVDLNKGDGGLVEDEGSEPEEEVESLVDELATFDEPEEEGESEALLAIVNAAGETRLSVLTRLNHYQRSLREPGNETLVQNLPVLFEDLAFGVESITEGDLTEKPITNGQFTGKTHKAALQQLLSNNKNQIEAGYQEYQALRKARLAYAGAADALMIFGEQLTSENRQRVDRDLEAVDRVVSTGTRTILITILIGLLLAIPLYFITVRSIAGPMREIRDQLNAIAHGGGDLTLSLAVKGNDETAELANAFNGFNGMLRSMIGRLQEAVHRLATTSVQIASVTKRTGGDVVHQQSEVRTVATAVNELAVSFQEVAGNTNLAAEKAVIADQEAKRGREVVTHTISVIEQVAEKVGVATNVVHSLGAKSESIGGVLDVIRGISEQTNLLALNAAIEAARAGQQGRGFAVVADEVRGLAARTHKSIAEIQGMIDQLQSGTAEAIREMDRARSQTSAAVEPSNQAGKSLQQIADVVSSISERNGQIAVAAESQSTTVADVERSMVSISDVATQTASSTHELTTSTQELNLLAEELQVLVGQFKV